MHRPRGAALGNLLSREIRKRRYKKAELARLSGVGRQTIYDLMKGLYLPAPSVLRGLADALEVDPLTGKVDRAGADQLYLELMGAAGYLEGRSNVNARNGETGEGARVRRAVARGMGAAMRASA